MSSLINFWAHQVEDFPVSSCVHLTHVAWIRSLDRASDLSQIEKELSIYEANSALVLIGVQLSSEKISAKIILICSPPPSIDSYWSSSD